MRKRDDHLLIAENTEKPVRQILDSYKIVDMEGFFWEKKKSKKKTIKYYFFSWNVENSVTLFEKLNEV